MSSKSSMPTWLIVLLVLIGIGLFASLFNTNHSDSRPVSTTSSSTSKTTSSPINETTASTKSNQDYSSSSSRKIVSQFPGCVSKKDLKSLIDYSRQHDDEAFNTALYEGLANGTMDIFNVGEEVFVSDIGVLSGMLTVRRKGETTKYWIVREAVDL